MAQHNHETLTIQVANGKRAKNDMGGKDNEVTISGPMTIRNEGSQREGARMQQTHTTSDG